MTVKEAQSTCMNLAGVRRVDRDSPVALLWLKLGGIAHILTGIFIALAAIVRALALMSHRLSYEMERTQG